MKPLRSSVAIGATIALAALLPLSGVDRVARVSGSVTNANCAQWNASGELVDSGGACGGGGGSGTVSSGTANQPTYYASNGTTVAGLTAGNGLMMNTSGSGVLSMTATPVLGKAGSTLGTLGLSGNTSGLVTLGVAAAAGTWTLNLPTSAGSNLQVLQTDGSGNTSWVAQSGGSGFTTRTDKSANTLNTAYQNTSGHTISVTITAINSAGASKSLFVYSNVSNPPTTNYVCFVTGSVGFAVTCTFWVLNNNYYIVQQDSGGNFTVQTWWEFS